MPSSATLNRMLIDFVNAQDEAGVRLALASGADPKGFSIDGAGSKPLLFHCVEKEQPSLPIIQMLMKAGARSDGPMPHNAWVVAVLKGDASLLSSMLDWGRPKPSAYCEAVSYALTRGYPRAVDVLLDHPPKAHWAADAIMELFHMLSRHRHTPGEEGRINDLVSGLTRVRDTSWRSPKSYGSDLYDSIGFRRFRNHLRAGCLTDHPRIQDFLKPFLDVIPADQLFPADEGGDSYHTWIADRRAAWALAELESEVPPSSPPSSSPRL